MNYILERLFLIMLIYQIPNQQMKHFKKFSSLFTREEQFSSHSCLLCWVSGTNLLPTQ